VCRGYDTVLNTHAPTQEKTDYSEGAFGEKLEQIFFHFLQDHIKVLLGFNAKQEEKIFSDW
jgi:hypothetical protein